MDKKVAEMDASMKARQRRLAEVEKERAGDQANQPLAHELEVGTYAKGIYLLKLVSDKQVMTKRIVIEH